MRARWLVLLAATPLLGGCFFHAGGPHGGVSVGVGPPAVHYDGYHGGTHYQATVAPAYAYGGGCGPSSTVVVGGYGRGYRGGYRRGYSYGHGRYGRHGGYGRGGHRRH